MINTMSEQDRSSLFARIAERRDVIDFVKEIEKHPCIYDQNSVDYANLLLKRRTWMDIAKKYNSAVPNCKEKWRKIRIAYMRSFKQSKSNNPPGRPYYLAEHLHFISPDGKCDDSIPTTSAQSPAPSNNSEDLQIDETDTENEENDEQNPEKTNLMSTRRDVVDFVKEIGKHPCLYDSNSFQYSNKLLKRSTWFEVAKKYKLTVLDCKEKWRKIRIAYMRYLKQTKSSSPPSRPYHLAEYLYFINPDRKPDENVPTTNNTSSDQTLKIEIEDYDHLADSEDDIDNDEDEHTIYLETNEPNEEIVHIPQELKSEVSNLSCTNMDRLTKEVNNRIKAEMRKIDGKARLATQINCLTDENNPRRMFLMSLLPDIVTLSEQEMRTFRREVIALLDNIISTREMNKSNKCS